MDDETRCLWDGCNRVMFLHRDGVWRCTDAHVNLASDVQQAYGEAAS